MVYAGGLWGAIFGTFIVIWYAPAVFMALWAIPVMIFEEIMKWKHDSTRFLPPQES